jgi:hypothetical protein
LQHDTKVKDWDTEISSVYHAEVDEMMKTKVYPGKEIYVK